MYDEFDDIMNNAADSAGDGGSNNPQAEWEEESNLQNASHAEQQEQSNEPESTYSFAAGENQDRRQYRGYHEETSWEQQPKDEVKQESKKEPKKNTSIWKKFAVCAGMAIVFGVAASVTFQATNYLGKKVIPEKTEVTIGKGETVAQTEVAPVSGTAVSTAGDVSQVAKNAMPSIVAITNKGVEEVESMFFGKSFIQQTESAGSGVIIAENDTELLIATNNHVVEGAEELTVCFSVSLENMENAVVKAQVKGTNADSDLAVVAVNKTDIPEDVRNQIKVIHIGDSASLEIGQQVIAIGNALGYGQSVTVGYVSALDREVTIDNITNKLIQTDAAINFGNSGGALLNAAGELIGINSAKAAVSGVEGMGYAIPMSTAQPILGDLSNRTTRAKVEDSNKGFLGVVPKDVSKEAKEIYNMPAGAYVYEVTEGGAANKAGIKKGDIIVKLDGESITSSTDLFDRMNYYKAGETIEVVVSTAQDGEYVERTVSVTLDKRPNDTMEENGNDVQTLPDVQDNNSGSFDNYYDYEYDEDSQFIDPFRQLFP